MAAPAINGGCHPFHSRERVNFPEFSPIFSRHVTPETQKPADIDTDPGTLIKTNSESPDCDGERQQASERFFSQHSILPSPWPTAQQRSSVRQTAGTSVTSCTIHPCSLTPGTAKKVTFSPHPPSLAYISSESLDSEGKETAVVDAATQTTLTIPFTYNLNNLLGPAFIYSGGGGGGGDDTVMGGVRDLANMSLRRKLFGQPTEEADGEGAREGEGGGREGEERETRAEGDRTSLMTMTPLKCTSRDRHLSSTPLKPHHPPQQHTSHYTPSPSPHIFPTGVGGDRVIPPAVSSFILPPGENLPEWSPIEGNSEGGVVISTRSKSMYSTHLTPSPLPTVTCPPFSPILSHHPRDDVRRECEGVRGASGDRVTGKPTTPTPSLAQSRASSANKATSTPYSHDIRRQQASMSSSPSTVQPHTDTSCTERERVTEAGSLPEGEGGRGEGMVTVGERDGEKAESSDSDNDLPQPLTMADLHTSEDDLTSVTGVTTCTTSYFTQLATDDGHTLGEKQPLHSTVAIPPNSTLNPLTTTTDPQWGATRLRLPSIREISRINAPSMNITDSGVVAASSDFNPPTGGHLTTSQGGSVGGLNSMNHSSPYEDMEREQMEICTKTNFFSEEYSHKSHRTKDEVDSGLAPSPAPATSSRHTEEGEEGAEVHEMNLNRVTTQGQTLGNMCTVPRDAVPGSAPQPNCRRTNITPSRYSTTQLPKNRMGLPLAITQKSIFTTNRTVLRHSHNILPSQLKLAPAILSPGLSSPGDAIHRRGSGCSNWFSESLTGCPTESRTSPIFPEAVLQKKETLKAQLNFCSPVHSRSPLSVSAHRKPLADTLNIPAPTSNLPFAHLPSPYLHASSLLPSPHLLSTLPHSPMSHTSPWQH